MEMVWKLFNAGAGNCHNGESANECYETFTSQLAKLPNQTLIYPGHEYLNNNLEFTLDREPDNENAGELLDTVQNQDPNNALITTLGQEKEINPFFCLWSPTVISRLREFFPDLPEDLDARTVFVKLRELSNSW